MEGGIRALFLPYETGELSPQHGGRLLFLNAAVPHSEAGMVLRGRLHCEQGHRGGYLDLREAGFAVEPAIESSTPYDGALVLAGKHAGENRHLVARACALTAPGAPVVVAGDKRLGIAGLRRWVQRFAALQSSRSKFHAVVFRFASTLPVPAEAESGEDRDFVSAPGMFSHARPDAGSQLLADRFDASMDGEVADFGCGWGYLSMRLLAAARPNRLTLYEAHHASLAAAMANVAGQRAGVEIAGEWLDLTRERPDRRHDRIIMNPPFHAGRAAEPAIGARFVETAAAALRPGGRLLMVANRKLPYEAVLQRHFRRTRQVGEGAGYKILEAVR